MSTKESTVTEFLLARIAEDEACVGDGDQLQGPVYIEGYGDQALIGGKRLLAECEAKRRIVAEHDPIDNEPHNWCKACDADGWPCVAMAAIASVYADHPDFRDEWRLR